MEDSVLTGRSRTVALCCALAAGLLTWWAAGWTDLPVTARSLGAVTVVMAAFWSMQPIPIAATSLLPIAVYPVLSTRDGCRVGDRLHPLRS